MCIGFTIHILTFWTTKNLHWLLPFLTWIDYWQLNEWPLTLCGIMLIPFCLINTSFYCTLQTEWSIIWYQTKPNALLIKIRDSALCWINIKFTLKPPEKRNNSSLPLLSYRNAFYSHNQSRQVSYVHCTWIFRHLPLFKQILRYIFWKSVFFLLLP